MWGCPCFLCTIPFCLPRLRLRQCIFRIIGKRVKSFHKRRCCITLLLSVLYNTYCFAFQKHRFYAVEQALLHRKTAAIAIPKRSYRFLTELFLQYQNEILPSHYLHAVAAFVGLTSVSCADLPLFHQANLP